MKHFTLTLKAICILFCLVFFHTSSAQENHDAGCGTIVTPEALAYFNSIRPQIDYYEQEYYEKLQNRASTAISSVPIKAHIVRTSAGTGGLSEGQLNAALANMNAFYANAFMEFYVCDGINYIDDDNFYDFETNDETALTSVNNVSGLINIYFTDNIVSSSSGGGICGYAYLPGGQDVILMANSCAINGSTLPHEVGHFFSLLHTHGPSNSTLTTELVNGSNCDTDGDFICDTPADPQLSYGNVTAGCTYIGTDMDANGDTFVPNPRNIMSYSRKECRDELSIQQFARIYAAFQTVRHYFSCPSFNAEFTSNYTRDCTDSLTVDFVDNSVGATSWQWDVDGDDLIDYTSQNPTHVYGPGTYDVRLTVSDGTNTITNVFANYISFETEIINTVQVNLELLTDNWCEETSWEFKDSNDTVLYSGGPYQQNVEDNTLFNYSFDVVLDECYSFVISDSYGDGICCFSGNGYYELTTDDATVIRNGGEIGFGESTFISNETLSLEEFFVDNISLFPNPTSDLLTIKMKSQSNLPDGLKIFNMLGQMVHKKDINGISDLTIDASSWNAGMYFIKVEKDNHSMSLPFIKK